MALFESMFCRMCGKQLDDDVKFCPNCGTDLSDAPVEETTAPAVDFTLNTQAVQPAKKKSKKLWAILIPVIAVVVAAAVALAMFLPGLLAAKADPQTMLDNAFDRAESSMASAISQYFSAYEQVNVTTDTAMTGSVGIALSQVLLELLGVGSGEDMTWLGQIRMDYLTAIEDNKMQVDVGLYLSETYIVGMEVSYDLESGKMWVGLPDLQDEPLFAQLENEDYNMHAVVPPYAQLLALLAEEKETVSLVMEKGWDALFSSLKAERVEEKTVTVGDDDYTVKAVYCYMDNQTSLEPEREFLTWLSEYDAFFDLLDRFEVLISGYSGVSMTGSAEAVKDAIDTAIDQLEEREYPGTRIDFCVYLNAAGEFVGISGLRDGVSVLEMITITEGSRTVGRFGDASVGILFDLSEENGATSGEITIKTIDDQNLSFRIEDLRMDQDNYSGTIEMNIPKELISGLTGGMGFAPEAALRLSMEGDAKAAEMKLELVVADMTMLTLTSAAETLKDYTVNLPEGGVDADDPDASEQWVLGLDYEQIITNILEAGVPESVVMAMIYGVVGQ